MQNTLREALMAQATFDIENTGNDAVKLCLLPGVYNTQKMTQDSQTKEVVINYSDPTALVRAGYAADQVADDAEFCPGAAVQVSRANARTMYRDFLNTVQRVGCTVNKIIFQNKTQSQDIYDQQIEIAKTVIGAKGGMDFITLQNYVNVNAYDRTKITIDISDEPLELTPEVFMALNIPAGAHFSVQFQFNTTVNI